MSFSVKKTTNNYNIITSYSLHPTFKYFRSNKKYSNTKKSYIDNGSPYTTPKKNARLPDKIQMCYPSGFVVDRRF